jgi:MFS transporter, SP family, arabinose:H+ symporter
MAAASIGLCLLSIIPQLFTCLLSRFLLGVLNALHMSLAGAFIKEIFPSSIRSPLGGVYSTSRIFGMLICFFFAYMAEYTVDKLEHIFIFLGPAFVSILQAFLFYQFMPDSIVEMITKQEEARAKQGIALFYPAHQVERRYLQMRLEIAATVKRTHSFEKIQLANRKNLCSLHLAMLRQFCGETYIVIYAREVMKYMDSPYANITPAVVNSIQLLAGLLGIIAVQKVSRFSLLVTSCCVLAILNVFIGITDLYDLPLECLITMTAFMMPCGVGLSSVAWSYPSELVPASQGKYSSFVNWTCSTMVAVIPPYVVAATSVRNAYPVFFFFAFYLVIAFGINLSVLPRVDRPIGENERTFLIPVR